MAQLVARLNGIQKATSSNLVISTTKRHRFGGAFFVAKIISHVREYTAERGRGRGRERFPPPKFSRRKRLVAFRMFTAKSV